MRDESAKWVEYDMAAEYCAKRGLSGDYGTPLYDGIGQDTMQEIEADVDAFVERVKATAYALAMEKIHAEFGEEL